ncbi:MAG: hypothetical protein PVI09_15970 [Anaerolineae bacterium]
MSDHNASNKDTADHHASQTRNDLGQPETKSGDAKRRSGCLTLWLLLLMALHASTLLSGLFYYLPRAAGSGGAVFLILSRLILPGFALAGLLALWKWQKRGFYVYALSAAIPLVNLLRMGSSNLWFLLAFYFGPIIILAFLLRSTWEHMS